MIQKSTFKPNWLMANPHIQTVWQTFFRFQPEIVTQRERFNLPDGDFIDLDWCGYEGGPLVLVLHGVAGSIQSPYAKGMLRAIADLNWHGVIMHFRGCSGDLNLLDRTYHCADTQDLAAVVAELRLRYPHKPIAVVGFSMGGNILLKWLGETGENNPINAATAVSVPLELEKAAYYINRGTSKIYQWWLLHYLRSFIKKKFKKAKKAPIQEKEIENIHSFLEFDNKITAPLHGFSNGHEYYQKASVRQYLKNIRVPTLLIEANDDPFMGKAKVDEQNELSPQLTLEISDAGGHVGFVAGTPWHPQYWLEHRIPHFFEQAFQRHRQNNGL